MSQTKAQLVGGVGISTVGDLTVFGAVNASGSVTASSFVGNLTGTASTATASATSFGLSGTPNVTVGVVTASSVSVSGNVSIAGTLTYEDVTNVDSIGIVTARAGVNVTGGSVVVGSAVTITSNGVNVTGISTFRGVHFNGGSALREKVNVTAGKLSDNTNINLENGMVYLFTTTETTTSTPNIRVSASTSLDSVMAVGDTVSVTIITTTAAAAYSVHITIDGSAVTERWLGGVAPTAGGSSGNDVYSFQIIKTAAATYTVLANRTNFA